MHDTQCSSCGSRDLMQDVKIVDHGYMDSKHDLAIELHAKPGALIFKDTRKGILTATVCGQCGKVELAVENPHELWDAYRQAQRG